MVEAGLRFATAIAGGGRFLHPDAVVDPSHRCSLAVAVKVGAALALAAPSFADTTVNAKASFTGVSMEPEGLALQHARF
jgi:hypothetical protein